MAIDIYMTFENDTDITPEAYVALRGLKGDTGEKGSDGNAGVGIEGITQNLDGTLTITLDDGSAYDTEPLRGEDGQDGVDGQDGADGNGIASAILNNDYTLTLTFTDGTAYTTPSIRGAQGIQGEQGVQGERGLQGDDGNGIASAVLNADYTLTLTFTDGTSYTTGSIRGEKGEKGDKGDKGEKGEQGDAGQVDTSMSSTSTLPVQNKAIKAYVDNGLSDKANTADIPTKVSDLTNDSGFITGYTETDPTVPAWAKASSKPTYTASEVGALPSSTFIPSKVSDLTNDSGFITGYTETDPVFTASPAHGISNSDISNWNGKSDFSGAYADLTGKPSEMTVAEAETGTETASRVLSPAVLNAVVNTLAQAVATTIAQGLLVEEFHLVDDALTIASDTSTAARSYTVTKAGYYPLGVMGWRVVNGNGTGGVYVVPRGGSLSSRSVGSATISTAFRTVGGAATNCSLYFSVLWMKVME